MTDNLTAPLTFLYDIENQEAANARSACSFLDVPPHSATALFTDIVVARKLTLGSSRYDDLVEAANRLVTKHKVERSIADWPFEHFWQNPDEPRHSRLLGYFIDPAELHHCGVFLLCAFLRKLNPDLPQDHWHVEVESAHIDILLTRNCSDGKGKYALIIENKVNGAVDQEKQLQRYVDEVRRRGFSNSETYVFYLPLTEGKDPTINSKGSIEDQGVTYSKVTFKDHILPWLSDVLRDESSWPQCMRTGMRDNLVHYHGLVRYLIETQKGRVMSAELLKKLQEASDSGTRLPTWNEAHNLIAAATELESCLRSVLRGKVLLGIQQRLKDQGFIPMPELYNNTGITIKGLSSPFDPLFKDEANLGLLVRDRVIVCVGACNELDDCPVYIGYMVNGQPTGAFSAVLEVQAQQHLGDKEDRVTDLPSWFAYAYDKQVTYDNAADEKTITSLTDKLFLMYRDLKLALGQTNA